MMIRASSVQNTPLVASQQTKRIVPPWTRGDYREVTLPPPSRLQRTLLCKQGGHYPLLGGKRPARPGCGFRSTRPPTPPGEGIQTNVRCNSGWSGTRAFHLLALLLFLVSPASAQQIY